jgi:hypothetical protein
MPRALKRDFLDAQHDVYRANLETWKRNERRFRAGANVFSELPRFPYEVKRGKADSAHYLARQLMATYINFPHDFAQMMAGFLMEKAPGPETGLNFGTLGQVRPSDSRTGEGDRAEAIYDNVDGVGNQGSMWPNFWTHSHMETYPFGHIVQMVENPAVEPENAAQEAAGLRPFGRNFTAPQMTDWDIVDGQFGFLVLRVRLRRSQRPRAQADQKNRVGYYLLVREGYDLLPEDNEVDFSEGGWFLFDSDKKFVQSPTGDLDEARWEDALDGEIPAWIYYYERDRGTEEIPAISRPGITELGNCAVSYMAVSSAADSDFLEAAASVLYVLGADKFVIKAVKEQYDEGAKVVGVPRPRGRQDADVTFFDASTGAVRAEVAETRLNRKNEEARDLMMREATSTPDSSGESKKAGFGERKGPVLALHASEAETAQTNFITFSEKRSGFSDAQGRATWTRDFDLTPLTDRIDEYFSIRQKSGLKSKTADVDAFLAVVQDKLGIHDKKRLTAIRSELEQRIDADQKIADAAAAADADFRAGAGA